MGKLRLLHLEITPVFVDDDGEHLTTLRGDTFAVPDAEVANFSETWASQFPALQARHEADEMRTTS